ncbi:MAG: hypothetical protein IPG04_39420 [Polyangiaceae bacterium]|nr:hypothetical protein [Polyangiaceae bacterium]
MALAEPLIGEGQGDHRFFLWYAQLTAAMSLYDLALIARAMSGFPAVRDLASTALHRCLAEEAMTLSRLGLTSTVDPARDIDGLRTLADARELPLQQIRARIWRAEVMLEGAAPPAQILSLLDDAERRQRRHRVANGIHTMLMNRNRGETLLRIGDRRAAEDLLLEAARVGRELAFTPIRISTTLARLYLLTDRLDDFCELGASSSTSEDVQQDPPAGSGGVLTLLAEVHRGTRPPTGPIASSSGSPSFAASASGPWPTETCASSRPPSPRRREPSATPSACCSPRSEPRSGRRHRPGRPPIDAIAPRS